MDRRNSEQAAQQRFQVVPASFHFAPLRRRIERTEKRVGDGVAADLDAGCVELQFRGGHPAVALTAGASNPQLGFDRVEHCVNRVRMHPAQAPGKGSVRARARRFRADVEQQWAAVHFEIEPGALER